MFMETTEKFFKMTPEEESKRHNKAMRLMPVAFADCDINDIMEIFHKEEEWN